MLTASKACRQHLELMPHKLLAYEAFSREEGGEAKEQYIYIYIYIHIYVDKICVHVCMYVFICICRYIYTHVYI
jgi:hypothetical protein